MPARRPGLSSITRPTNAPLSVERRCPLPDPVTMVRRTRPPIVLRARAGVPLSIAGPASGVVGFFQAEDGIRDLTVTGVQTCALPICIIVNSGHIGQIGSKRPTAQE